MRTTPIIEMEKRFDPKSYESRWQEEWAARGYFVCAVPGAAAAAPEGGGGTPGAAPAITLANVPAFATTPAAADAITVAAGSIAIPE